MIVLPLVSRQDDSAGHLAEPKAAWFWQNLGALSPEVQQASFFATVPAATAPAIPA